MSRYRTAFETLADRGTPRGFDALADGLQDNESRSRRRWRWTGPRLAVAAALAVIVVGGAVIWSLRPAGDGPVATPDTGVTLRQVDSGFWLIVPGPENLLAESADGLHSSTDGETWEVVVGVQSAQGRIVSTGDRFAIVRGIAGDEGTLTSRDATDWIAIENPSMLGERLGTVVASAEHVLAFIEDPFDEVGPTVFRLADDRWELLQPTSAPDAGAVIAGGDGFVAVERTDDGFVSTRSSSGATWATGDRVALTSGTSPTDLLVLLPIADDWMLLVIGRDGADAQAFVSSDGLDWERRPEPPFRSVRWWGHVGDHAYVVTETAVWNTADGVRWARAPLPVQGAWIVGAGSIDSHAHVFWIPPMDASDVVTTTLAATPGREPDQAGLSAQERIIADDRVTRDEFEDAIAAYTECLEAETGVTITDVRVEPNGSFSFSGQGPDHGSADAYCWASHVELISEFMAR